ncbi:transcriptional regulator [Sphingomonas sp. DBB INV C78]|uniref:AraC family transcriptional regulator n=1 Tax=Sphingomonas sp. DBB INV C78 TaxID=3349434 RepID=UPI0036D3DBDD
MTELMRVAALTGYFSTMREFRVDPRPILKDIGLSPDLLTNPEQLISARAAIRLLEKSAAATGCLTLGLRMAEGRSLADLGTTSLLIVHQPTLRLSLEALAEFRNRVNSTLVLHFEQIGEEVILREDFSLSTPEPSRQASNLAMGVIARLCATVLGDQWEPQAACFAHEAPPSNEMAIFRRLFRCPPQFNSPFNGIVLDARDLDRPNPKADAALALHARRLIESVVSPARRSPAQEVEQIVMLLLPSGRANIQTCADSMGLTIRTLQRLLDGESTSFSQLLNRARMQLAAQYLANPKVRVTDVADMLGYSSIGAFTRWHVQTFGMSPRESRRGGGTVNIAH